MEHPMEAEFSSMMHEGRDISYTPHNEEVSYANLASKSTSRFETPPVDMEWRNLEFSVPIKAEKKPKDAASKAGGTQDTAKAAPRRKTILSDINGHVKSGQMLAVMGSSGAGKTSLLNLLAGRITTSKGAKASGSVYVNDEPRDYTKFRQVSAYVLQDDDMFAELTVREQISYAARLRLPKEMSEEQKLARVDRVIQELGLSKVANSQIGGMLVRGISGGERKRVNIGTELVTDPALLFLDEPTTGLDSFNALNVMQSLRHLASSGRTIVSTIHQPRSSIFQLFDQLVLLSEGRVMYMGPAKDAVAYFSSLNFKCPSNFNPADFFLDLLSVDPRNPEREQTTVARIKYIGDTHAAAAENPSVTAKAADLEGGVDGSMEPRPAEPQLRERQFQSSWLRELQILTGRSLRLALREKTSNSIRLGQVIFFSVLLGIVWLNKGRGSTKEDQFSVGGVLFFIIINQAFGGAFSVIFQFPLERSVVTRERASNMYRTSSYFISKTFTDMPKTLLFNSLFAVIMYFMVGLRLDAGAFFKFLLVIFLVSTLAEGIALSVSIMTGDAQAASSLIPLCIIIFLLWVRLDARVQIGPSGIPFWVNVAALAGIVLASKIMGYLFLHYLRGPKFLKF